MRRNLLLCVFTLNTHRQLWIGPAVTATVLYPSKNIASQCKTHTFSYQKYNLFCHRRKTSEIPQQIMFAYNQWVDTHGKPALADTDGQQMTAEFRQRHRQTDNMRPSCAVGFRWCCSLATRTSPLPPRTVSKRMWFGAPSCWQMLFEKFGFSL